jgi:hypothetical protein
VGRGRLCQVIPVMAEEGQRCAGVSGGQTHLARLQHKINSMSDARFGRLRTKTSSDLGCDVMHLG